MIEELKAWAEKARLNKKGLDKKIFDDIMKIVLSRLEKEGYKPTFDYLQDNCIKGQDSRMNGVILLRNNSKLIKDKMWSLNRQKEKIERMKK